MSKVKSTTQEESNELNVLFPDEEVILDDGRVIIMRPLSLVDIPRMKEAFFAVMDGVDNDQDDSAMGASLLFSAAALIPHCIKNDIDADTIPLAEVPKLIKVFIAQNLNEAARKNWAALMEGMGEGPLGQNTDKMK